MIGTIRVHGRIRVDVHRAGILPVDCDGSLPAHGGGQIHLVRQRFFTCSGVAHVDQDVQINVALPGVRLEIEEVGPEIKFSIPAGRRVTAVTQRKGHQIAGAVVAVAQTVDITDVAPVVVLVEGE